MASNCCSSFSSLDFRFNAHTAPHGMSQIAVRFNDLFQVEVKPDYIGALKFIKNCRSRPWPPHYMSSGWFDCTKPSLSIALQGKPGVQCAYALGLGGSSAPRTFSDHSIAELAWCGEFCHRSLGWFDCTKPSLSTSLQGKQGVQCAYALVHGGSSASHLLEPS